MKKRRILLTAAIVLLLVATVPMAMVQAVMGFLEREEARENAIRYEAYYHQVEREMPESYADSASIRNYEPRHGIK